jgi:hypothetical protein
MEGQNTNFKNLCEQFVARVSNEKKCLYYGFSFNGDEAYCREGYEDAAGLLAHLENVNDLIEKALSIAEITRLEVHGPEAELKKLYEPLAPFKPQFFILEYGFRR